MKRFSIIVILSVLFVSIATIAAYSAEAESKEDMMCPVLGVKLDDKTKVPYEYKGKTYYFCCQNCVEEFKKDPEKYLMKAEMGEHKMHEHGNEVCPVLGGKLDDKTKVPYEYMGKTYYFCCDQCVEEFKKDPEKYLMKLKEMEKAEGNEMCPVLGGKLDDKTKVAYEYMGKTYYFCCDQCVEEFKKYPEKYIKNVQ